MTRAEKWRRGSLIGWFIGAIFTGFLFYSLSPVKGWVAFGVCVVGASLSQYILTLFEGVLVHGEIPHPLHRDADIRHKAVWVLASAALLIDAYMNYNGIASVIQLVNSSNTLAGNDKDVIKGIAIIFAVIVALAPEVCNVYADILDGKGRVVVNKPKDKLPFVEDQTLVKVNRDLENQNNGLRNRLKELEGQLNKNNHNQNNDNGRLIEDNFNIGRRKK